MAAAAQLQLAQPALSRQIRDLESELGVELLAREASGSRLTTAGEAVVRAARSLILSVRSAISRARLAEHGLVGRCVLGAGREPLANGIVARFIQLVRGEFPAIELVVDDRSLRAQWDAISTCEVDIAIGTAPPAHLQQLAVETYSMDAIDAVLLSATHPLASRPTLELEDLRGVPLIRNAPEMECKPTRLVEAEMAARGFAPDEVRHATSEDMLRMLVRAGIGWAAIPGSVGQALPRDLVAIPLSDFRVAFRYVHIRRHSDTRPLVRSLLGALRRASAAEGIAGPRPRDPGLSRLPSDARAGLASRIELRHIRYFAAVIEEGTIGRAAERMGITQPALSRQLRDLEEETGASLVTRAARGVAPTLAGETLYADARRILAAADQIAPEARRAVRGATGPIVVGIASSPPIWDLVTRAVASFSSTHPATLVTIDDVPTLAQESGMREARLDVAIGLMFPSVREPDPHVVRVPLVPDVLDSALLHAGHPLAARTEIALEELEMLPFLFMKRDFIPAFYDLVMSEMARAGYRPSIDGTYDALPTVWALAAQGIGWGLGSSSQSGHLPNGVVAVRLRDFEVPFGCELAFRRDEERPAVLALIAAMQEAASAAVQARHGMPRKEVLAARG